MTDQKLLSSLSRLGFPMFEPVEQLDVNETLAEVVKSDDMRLWEGFPVLLANAADTYQFAPDRVEQHLESQVQKDHFRCLMLFSGALFSLYHLSFTWWNTLKKCLSEQEKGLVRAWKKDLTRGHPVEWYDTILDSERVKGLFELYFEKKAETDKRRQEKHAEFSLEYALSQVFSPKQKELFKKKLEGLPLTKTEKEYYSRTVKKKVVALANDELHSLSKKLLEF
jgi:hypothetical protein